MRGFDELVRLRQWRLGEIRRKVEDLEHLAARLRGEIAGLEAAILREWPGGVAAADGPRGRGEARDAAVRRCETLRRSLAAVEAELAATRDEVAAADRELGKFDVLRARRGKRAGTHAGGGRERPEQNDLRRRKAK